MTQLHIRRAYEKAQKADGARVLVDRLWPRGVAKADAQIDKWFKEVAPSSQLRKWYGHDPDKFEEFKSRYEQELQDEQHAEQWQELQKLTHTRNVTLVTATKDVEISAAQVLHDLLKSS
ncbi:DUF488 family protein [Gleimia hominis]|uniref:DUF488 family protein n=1 Tax=Gleimia hominis TaxID=595468 RepID=A0ABU3IAD0_9ACTO|nr:DUF488 family protein [Gleimia hominis]MDT3767325.1 DUF488 family protein [Gleimia hominis]